MKCPYRKFKKCLGVECTAYTIKPKSYAVGTAIKAHNKPYCTIIDNWIKEKGE